MVMQSPITHADAVSFTNRTQQSGVVPVLADIADATFRRYQIVGKLTRAELASVALATGCAELRQALASKARLSLVWTGSRCHLNTPDGRSRLRGAVARQLLRATQRAVR